MRVADLEAAIVRDRDGGPAARRRLSPAPGRSTPGPSTRCAEIAEVCRRHDVWLHVDGAYGGPAVLTARYRDGAGADGPGRQPGIDPHKWLYVPVEAGLALVRDGEAMRDTFSLVPPYIRTEGNPGGVYGLPWFSEYGFQQTRAFRALKVWMALKHHGLDRLRRGDRPRPRPGRRAWPIGSRRAPIWS